MLTQSTLRRTINRRFAVVTAATLIAVASAPAMAVVVCGPGANIPVPATFSGVYINL